MGKYLRDAEVLVPGDCETSFILLFHIFPGPRLLYHVRVVFFKGWGGVRYVSVCVTKVTSNFSKICVDKEQDRKSRKTAVKHIVKGGLGILSIINYVNALKLVWIRKLKTSYHKWKSIIKTSYP